MATLDLATDVRPALALPSVSPRAGTTIVELDEARLPEAARLYAAGYDRLRRSVSALSAADTRPESIAPLLRRALLDGTAVAALRDGELVGYLAGVTVQGLRGSDDATWVPEWAHGLGGPSRLETWHALYAEAAARWLAQGRSTHCVTVLADDVPARDAVTWLGFGLVVVDGLARSVDLPHADPPAGVTIEQASLADLPRFAPLAVAHDAWYGGAPIFVVRDADDPPVPALERWLTTPGEAVVVARDGRRPLGFIYLRPPGHGACRVTETASTIAVGGAFTVPDARGTGIGRALLSAARDWALGAGHARMSVDYEAANLPARRFWRRWFTPVCLSFERHVDDRLRGHPMEGAR